MTVTRTDFLGQPYGPGDLIVYPAGRSHRKHMILARVVRFTTAGNTVVQPLGGSRGTYHGNRISYVDMRTGKKVNPYNHVKVKSHYVDTRTGKPVDWGNVPRQFCKYVPHEFYGYIRKIEQPPSPVTLYVSENIVRIAFGSPSRRLYRTTRYDQTGRCLWRRYSTSAGRYAATVGDLPNTPGTVTLEVTDIDETRFTPHAVTVTSR